MIIPILLIALILYKDDKGLGALKKSRWHQVYINGKINPDLKLSSTKKQKGVYILKKKDDIVYIGYSGSNLYKTLTRHFQSWQDNSQVRITFTKGEKIKARIIYTSTAQQAYNLEKALIKKYKPSENPNQYESEPITPFEENIIIDMNRADAEF